MLLGEITAMKEPIALKQFHVAKRSEKSKSCLTLQGRMCMTL